MAKQNKPAATEVDAATQELIDAAVAVATKEANNKLAASEKKNKALTEELESAKAENVELTNLNDEMTKALNDGAKGTGNSPIKDSKGTIYKMIFAGVNFGGKRYTASDLATNKEVVDELVKIGYGGLKKAE